MTVGSPLEDRWRLDQLLGRAGSEGYLLRSPSSSTLRGGARLRVLAPELELASNSKIPFSVNDGAMWAGHGLNGRAMAGVAAEAGALRVVLAPEFVWSENLAFDALLPVGWSPEQRATFYAPSLAGRHSADLPFRPGDRSVRGLYPGQSSLSLTAGPLVAGAATENQWWGPGVRNAILFSNNAAGFAHLFVRTGTPIRTRVGAVEAKWLVGALNASEQFASGSESHRSISALGVTVQPAVAPGLTVGLARSVYSPVGGTAAAAGRFLDVLGHWGAGRDTVGRPAEQILALSGRWVVPGYGEVYGEWARQELPTSFRDLLVQPEHSQGFVLGAQAVRAVGSRGVVRLQAEHAYLEESPTVRARPLGSFYASARVPQGYTERGQVIGAAVGPGGSGQWVAADYMDGAMQVGVFGGRHRWANDAYYDNPDGNARYRGHDVTVLAGTRLGLSLAGVRLGAEWTAGKRFNYLFQSYAYDWDQRENTVNVVNHTLRLQISAAPRAAGESRR